MTVDKKIQLRNVGIDYINNLLKLTNSSVELIRVRGDSNRDIFVKLGLLEKSKTFDVISRKVVSNTFTNPKIKGDILLDVNNYVIYIKINEHRWMKISNPDEIKKLVNEAEE